GSRTAAGARSRRGGGARSRNSPTASRSIPSAGHDGRDSMKCPFCGRTEDRVVDSRVGRDGEFIRRRRECLKCRRRYTTYEHIENVTLHVAKQDGRREE